MPIGRVVRGVALLAVIVAGSPVRADDVSALLDQNWTAEEQTSWYEASQGSRLIPLSWLRSLELAGNSQQAFLADDHITALRYIPRDMKSWPGLRLPIGFAVDRTDDNRLGTTKLRWKEGQSSTEPWVGMNCSACHTTAITYKGKSMTVDGGSTLADFQTFVEHLNEALRATRDDSSRFARFAKNVLGADETDSNRSMLKKELGRLVETQQAIATLNHTDLRYGFGRLDAVGNILNKVAFASGAAKPVPNPSDAPVSYPFLWGTPKHDRIEWNGIAGPNQQLGIDLGGLARNTGEVIGVFGDVVVQPNPGLLGFFSSASVDNLVNLEYLLTRLRAPKWPEKVLGVPGTDTVSGAPNPPARSVERGRVLFNTSCASCHTVLDRTNLTTPVKIHMSPLLPPLKTGDERPIGTDPWMACNAIQFKGPTGKLKGQSGLDGDILGDEAALASMLTVLVKGVLLNQKGDLAGKAIGGFFGYHPLPKVTPPVGYFSTIMKTLESVAMLKSDKERRKEKCFALGPEFRRTLAYKGRPLNGVWATAPYLHNGSVPTLYDLLLPPDQRPKTFNVGTREFDPARVGYLTTQGPENSFPFDTAKEGNSNAGHDYNNKSLSDDDRQALVEYMKTL